MLPFWQTILCDTCLAFQDVLIVEIEISSHTDKNATALTRHLVPRVFRVFLPQFPSGPGTEICHDALWIFEDLLADLTSQRPGCHVMVFSSEKWVILKLVKWCHTLSIVDSPPIYIYITLFWSCQNISLSDSQKIKDQTTWIYPRLGWLGMNKPWDIIFSNKHLWLRKNISNVCKTTRQIWCWWFSPKHIEQRKSVVSLHLNHAI